MKKLYLMLMFVSLTNLGFAEGVIDKFNFEMGLPAIYQDGQNKITLRRDAVAGATSTVSYIVELNEEINNDSKIYLRLLDGQDFQISQVFLARVCRGFKGKIKGNFTVNLGYQLLYGVELTSYADN